MRGDKLFLILVVLLVVNLVSGGVSFGNLSHSFDKNYASGGSLRGWVNVSFDNEDEDSLVSVFGEDVSVARFLELNDIDCSSSNQCSCFPLDCRPGYSTVGSVKSSETYSLGFLKNQLFGIKVEGNVSQVTSFGFNVSTNAGSSCFKPLFIDLLDDDSIEWIAEEIGDETCFIEDPYGCYNEADVAGQVVITTEPLCEKITLPPMKGFRVGTNINGTGGATFHITLNAEGVDLSQGCVSMNRESSYGFVDVIDKSIPKSWDFVVNLCKIGLISNEGSPNDKEVFVSETVISAVVDNYPDEEIRKLRLSVWGR